MRTYGVGRDSDRNKMGLKVFSEERDFLSPVAMVTKLSLSSLLGPADWSSISGIGLIPLDEDDF